VTHEFYQVLQAVQKYSNKIDDIVSEVETLCMTIDTVQETSSLVSSAQEDGKPMEPKPVAQPIGPMSIEEEIAKLENKVTKIRRSVPSLRDKGYIPPKIRKVTPK